MGEVVGYRNFFSNTWVSGTRTADAGRSTPTYYISNDAVLPKDVPFGDLRNYIWGVIPKNSLIFWPEWGFPA
jgi:hypothetical protein